MYTLIIMWALSYPGAGSRPALDNVPAFKNEAACELAAAKIRLEIANAKGGKAILVCVKDS